MRKDTVVITLQDTKEELTFGGEKQHENIFELQMTVREVDPKTGNVISGYAATAVSNMHVTLKTLQKSGCITLPQDRRPANVPDTTADLLLALLEHLDIYPQE